MNQGRNNDTRSTTVAVPAILSAWDNRAASKLNPGTAALDLPPPTGDVLAGLGAAPPAGAPQRGHGADSSASWLPHREQNICLPPELAHWGSRSRAILRLLDLTLAKGDVRRSRAFAGAQSPL
jgi:hypothetical protein